MGDEQAERVAWFVKLDDFDGIVFAATAAKAKWVAVSGWREAGYGAGQRWPVYLSARRMERFDQSSWRTKPQALFNELHVPLF